LVTIQTIVLATTAPQFEFLRREFIIRATRLTLLIDVLAGLNSITGIQEFSAEQFANDASIAEVLIRISSDCFGMFWVC
jgi:hypothetical protein